MPLDAGEVAEALVAIVPPHRRDLAIEADIAEEIARVRGYETIAGRLPDTTMPGYRPDGRRTVDAIRDALAGAGLAELVTHGLIGPEDHARLGWAPGDPDTIRASNPVTLDHSELRRSLIPEHLRVHRGQRTTAQPGRAGLRGRHPACVARGSADRARRAGHHPGGP